MENSGSWWSHVYLPDLLTSELLRRLQGQQVRLGGLWGGAASTDRGIVLQKLQQHHQSRLGLSRSA